MWEEWWKDSWFLGDPCNGFCCATQQRNPTPHKVSSPSAEDCPLPGAAKGHLWNVSCGPLYFALSFFNFQDTWRENWIQNLQHRLVFLGETIASSSFFNHHVCWWTMMNMSEIFVVGCCFNPQFYREIYTTCWGVKRQWSNDVIPSGPATQAICCGGQSSWYRSESERVLPSLWVERKIWTRIHVFFFF